MNEIFEEALLSSFLKSRIKVRDDNVACFPFAPHARELSFAKVISLWENNAVTARQEGIMTYLLGPISPSEIIHRQSKSSPRKTNTTCLCKRQHSNPCKPFLRTPFGPTRLLAKKTRDLHFSPFFLYATFFVFFQSSV